MTWPSGRWVATLSSTSTPLRGSVKASSPQETSADCARVTR